MSNPKKKKNTITSKKIAVLENKLQRSLADYSNLEKRIEKQRQLFVTLATVGIVSKMVDILDDLYLAHKHLKDPGLKITIKKFSRILEEQGLKEIKAKGQEFNAKSMDCVDVATGKQDHVISIRKKGYTLNDHVIRPAQVVVGRQIKN
ncbi:nucleotide exchange factor GrpE [archaeon]|nr:nucleotide exchange factor GrpE [archaeon]